MNPAAAYIIRQQPPYREILLYLQAQIESTLPEAELKFRWKVPFYYLFGKPFCYLNQRRDYVDLGFWDAAHLRRHPGQLVSDGRKVMRSLRYTSLGEIDETVLREVLQEARGLRQ